ncbi:MAG: hypothetical protein OXU20_26705 [Myxococcales bacterium]|nr:hypothetical protein [Myxococcales bacterium]MDD9971378.1 hypothetical protein [Myxococcales bacterium]
MYRVVLPVLFFGSTASLALGSSAALAQHRDFLLARDGNRVAIGAFDWGASTAVAPTYLRAGAFEYAEQDYAVATNPGFNAIEQPPKGYSPLPGDAEVDFSFEPVADLSANLAYWSGTPPVAFERAHGESILWASQDGRRASADGGDERVDGFVLASTSGSGVFHEHIEIVLLGAESMQPRDAEVAPRPGIYALAIAFRVEGLEDADPAYLLLQQGELAEGSLETAERWVRTQWLDAERRGVESTAAPPEQGTEEPIRDCGLIGDGTLGPGIINHACQHARHGPFDRVAAPSMASETANVDKVHTLHTVFLRSAEGGAVTYEPKRSGKWAVLSDLEASPVVTDASGVPQAAVLAYTTSECDGLLPWIRVYDLTAGERYQLRYAALNESVDEAAVLIEKLSDFDTRHGADRDGDGFGDPERVVVTPCTPSDAYVANVDDCDDDDPSVHPDVPGACEPIDDCSDPFREGSRACDPVSDAGATPTASMENGSGGGCSTASEPARARTWLLALGLWALLRRRRHRRAVTTAALLLMAGGPAVRAQHIDILLAQRQGRVETGGYDFGKAMARMPRGAFSRTFERLDSDEVSGNDPGMAAVNNPPGPWSALPANASTTVGPAYRSADGGVQVAPLTYWDGVGEVHFAPAPPPLALRVVLGGLFGPQSAFSLDGEGAAGEPFEFATTDNSGALHQHLDFTLSSELGLQPPAGIYLLSLRFGVGDLASSPPVAVLLHHGVAETAVDRATQCAADYLVPDCDDGIDNDGDGEADLDDPGCTNPSDLSERDDCDDGLDNDGDARVDSEDVDCRDPQGSSECGDAPCLPFPQAWTCAGALKATVDGGADAASATDAGVLVEMEVEVEVEVEDDAGLPARSSARADAAVADPASANDAANDETSAAPARSVAHASGCSLARPTPNYGGWSVLLVLVLFLVGRTIRPRGRR